MSETPSAIQLFGPNPWITDPVPGANTPVGFFPYNNHYFATKETALKVATLIELGSGFKPGSCKVVESDDITDMQNMPNQMIQTPDTLMHNAGLIAGIFDYWSQVGGSLISAQNAMTAELNVTWVYVPIPLPTTPVVKPTPGAQLLVGKIGSIQLQADGTYWKRVASAQG